MQLKLNTNDYAPQLNPLLCVSRRWCLLYKALSGRNVWSGVQRFTTTELAAFLTRLVLCTTTVDSCHNSDNIAYAMGPRNKPEWWPDGWPFRNPFDDLDNGSNGNEQRVRLLIYELIDRCRQYFQHNVFESKWHRRSDRIRMKQQPRPNYTYNIIQRRRLLLPPKHHTANIINRSNYIDIIRSECRLKQPRVIIENCFKNTTTSRVSRSSSSSPAAVVVVASARKERDEITATLQQNDFMNYFGVYNNNNNNTTGHSNNNNKIKSIVAGGVKITSCPNVPISSDLGRLITKRDHHFVPDGVKLKRLEKIEWYVNKVSSSSSSSSYSTITNMSSSTTGTSSTIPSTTTIMNGPATSIKHKRFDRDWHTYKMPKRQNYQTRQSLHSEQFLKQFCSPLVVKLSRLSNVVDLPTVDFKSGDENGKETDRCKSSKILRCSPRLIRLGIDNL